LKYPEELSHQKCAGLDPNTFFDSYEESATDDGVFARKIDSEYCLQCPALQLCLETGIKTKSYGVWGGVYLEDGKVSKKYNAHKAATDWQTIAEAIND
jgi:Transcription factor WhiB